MGGMGDVEEPAGPRWADFQEMPIEFPPTYKYDPGTDTYDSGKKRRVPVWTDRVLWRGEAVTPRTYDAVPDLKVSDHRPVVAQFDLLVRLADWTNPVAADGQMGSSVCVLQ